MYTNSHNSAIKCDLFFPHDAFIIFFSGLITGYLTDKIFIRYLVLFGAVLSLGGFTLSAFGPSIYYTIIGYGVITG